MSNAILIRTGRLMSMLAIIVMALVISPAVHGADEKPAAPSQTETAAPPVKPEAASPAGQSSPAAKDKSSAHEGNQVAWLSIDKPLRESPSPLAWVNEEDAGLSLLMAVNAIDRVAADSSMRGLVINLDSPQLSLTQIDALSAAIARLRATGKQVMIFADAYDMPSYLLATACDRILLQHKGRVELHGLGVEEMYLAGLLSKLGLKADFIQVGKFKGADEALTRTGPSEAWNENFNALLDDLYNQVIGRISKGRGLQAQEIEALFTDVWYLSDTQLVERKVVDEICDRDLTTVTSRIWGDQFSWVDLAAPPRKAGPQNPLAVMSLLFQERTPRIRKPSIAVIWAHGQITGGESAIHLPTGSGPAMGPDSGLFGGSSIGSRTIIKAVEEARDNSMIKGVVFFIDSPGGSALASELMWQSVRDLAQYKPVYVVVGSMAASGGYYIACAADQVYVSPTSIVGSIGVVGGKIVLGDLYEKLGISVHRRSRGPMGDLFNSVEPFSDQQRDALKKAFEFTYAQFLDRVTTGRGDRLPDIHAVAQGKLFTGKQAVTNGMADRIGGVEQAILDMAKDLELEAGKYDTVNLPAPLNFADFLNRTFGGVHAPGVQVQVNVDALTAARQVLGPRVWRTVAPTLGGLMLLQQEPVLTLMPSALIVR